MLPPIFRTFFAKRKPAPPRCTADNLHAAGLPANAITDLRGCSHDAFCGGAIPQEAYRHGTYGAQWISDELRRAGDPTPDKIARQFEGE